MIQAQNISKFFGTVKVLDNITFKIQKGEVVGFLGKNGAGKTTLMRILTTYFAPTQGRLLMDGEDALQNTLLIRQKIGYLPENLPLYMNMTVKDYLKFSAQLKGIPSGAQSGHIERVLEECDLKNVFHKTIAALSKGYKQRIGIAQANINEPDILILDEPTNGLDPLQILQVRQLIKKIEKNRIIILSTHILSEIEQIAGRVLILKEGRLVFDEKLIEKTHTLEDIFIQLHQS